MYVEPLSEPIPFEMGLQMPRRVCPQAAAESSLWESPPAAGGDFPRAGPAEGMSDPGRASEAGPCAHVCGDSPKYPVASVIGFLKGKSAIAVARLCGREQNFTGEHLWARGYAVSTVGFELEQIRRYIHEQEKADG